MNAGPASPLRYAIYWAPEPAHALAQLGEQWLSQDPSVAPISEPALYGFHATLKPPFRLAEGCSEAELLRATQRLAWAHRAFDMPVLRVARLQGFVALRPQPQIAPAHPLWRLADACVSELDGFRRPPAEAELLKRRSVGLDAEQEALMQCWGYPHVLQRWRFHMTLTNSVFEQQAQQGPQASPQAEALLARLQALFAPALAQPLRCDSICIFEQREAGQAFRLSHRFDLAP
ncbi:DUF1045 domain-containing protein [Roseateles oligotrophus]|uniref:DUF1045 domain-containing protein n=1 Tax=Roseateles oligotrophus TaxID=1769250 RepID=A0ABT2YC33_9BURK|nr:DUF1045 domain-containing protein [Roseateles oligotrophus]MCV2367589.1 DUF1045 domain-containing protein [Roseateles oligotrophus]